MPLDQLWLVERSGASPGDTTVTFPARAGRTIVLRHPPPDNATFAVVRIPPDSGATGELTLTLRPMPARYGLAVEGAALPEGTTLRYSYAGHFVVPEGALVRYFTPARFEQGLGIGVDRGDGRVQFVAARRPAADQLEVPLGRTGTWYLAAPR